jgi:hypothetical protein
MTQETSNHGYNTPEKGASNWHEPLNENFESLDADVIVKGPHGERPASPPAGTWYLSTDRNLITYYDGSSWNAVAGLGTATEPAPQANYERLSATKFDIRGSQVQRWLSWDEITVDGEGTNEVSITFQLDPLFSTRLKKQYKRAFTDIRVSAWGDTVPLWFRWELFVMRTGTRQYYVKTFRQESEGPRPFDWDTNNDGEVEITLRAKGPISEVDVEVPVGFNPRELSD